MKKKALALLLATSMVAGLTACGGKTDAPAADGKTEQVRQKPVSVLKPLLILLKSTLLSM